MTGKSPKAAEADAAVVVFELTLSLALQVDKRHGIGAAVIKLAEYKKRLTRGHHEPGKIFRNSVLKRPQQLTKDKNE